MVEVPQALNHLKLTQESHQLITLRFSKLKQANDEIDHFTGDDIIDTMFNIVKNAIILTLNDINPNNQTIQDKMESLLWNKNNFIIKIFNYEESINEYNKKNNKIQQQCKCKYEHNINIIENNNKYLIIIK